MTTNSRWAGVVAVFALTCFSSSARAEDSNRNEVRAGLEKDGWRVIWGKNFTEADWARGTKAIAESIATENPGPFLAWFEQTLQENFAKIQRNLAGVTKADLERWVVQSLKAKRPITFKGLQIEAGFATYNRWQRTVVEVPDGIEFQGIKSKVKMKKIENKIPLPNWHQFYIRYKLVENRPAGSGNAGGNPATPERIITYTIKNNTSGPITLEFFPSGTKSRLEPGRTTTCRSPVRGGQFPKVKAIAQNGQWWERTIRNDNGTYSVVNNSGKIQIVP